MHRDARNRHIIDHLADKKFEVSAQMVSTVRATVEGAIGGACWPCGIQSRYQMTVNFGPAYRQTIGR